MPHFSIIIPVFNKWELTRNCLASLCEHGSGPSFEVIVVDNGSTDATATELASFGESLFGEQFRAIVLPENKNFGPACNLGAKTAKAPVLFFLNNDTLVTSGWAEPLLTALHENDAVGAVGPLLLYPDNTVQHVGVAFGAVGPLHLYQNFPEAHPVIAKARDLQSITGAAFMIQTDFFHACGSFCEEYKNGFEDLDLCVQIRKNGKKLRCVPQSRVYHLESQTPKRKANDTENSRLFTQRCKQDVYIDLHYHALRDGFDVFITDLFTIGVRLKNGQETALTAQAKTFGDATTWAKLVRENPFWVRGREVLAQSLEQAGRQREAVFFRMELAEIEPFFPRYRDMVRLASFAKHGAKQGAEQGAAWLEVVTRDMAVMERLATDKGIARKKIHSILEKSRQGRDELLETLYHEKFTRLFPE
ncbi:MAG: hypothetical protein DELT_02153 [Desulfovibrio sp.]